MHQQRRFERQSGQQFLAEFQFSAYTQASNSHKICPTQADSSLNPRLEQRGTCQPVTAPFLGNYQILHAQKLFYSKLNTVPSENPRFYTVGRVRQISVCFDPVRLLRYRTARLTHSIISRNDVFPGQADTGIGHDSSVPRPATTERAE